MEKNKLKLNLQFFSNKEGTNENTNDNNDSKDEQDK